MSGSALLTEDGLWMLAHVHRSINTSDSPQLGFFLPPFCLQMEYMIGCLNINGLFENVDVLIALIKDIFSAIALTSLLSKCCLNKLM